MIIEKGNKYNRLTAVKFDHMNRYFQQHWLFKCECGVEKVICVNNVKNGITKSCGCLKKEMVGHYKNNLIHGMSGTKVYKVWAGMIQRCFNINNKNYKNYGKRGIMICKRWLDFQNFYKDMGDVPNGKSIDRINNNGNYEPKNCRWATQKEQMNNTRRNRYATYKGKTQTIAQWSRELKENIYTLKHRKNTKMPKNLIICRLRFIIAIDKIVS